MSEVSPATGERGADSRGLAAVEHWRAREDPEHWALWLCQLRSELRDPGGESREYVLRTWAVLVEAGMDLSEIEALGAASRPVLSQLMSQVPEYRPWPVPAYWWSEQSELGRFDVARYVAHAMAIGADDERPNGARFVAASLELLERIHSVNENYYATHDVPMDDCSVEGVRHIRSTLLRLADLAAEDAAVGADLLANYGQRVEIREHLVAENERLRDQIAKLSARLDSAELDLLRLGSEDSED